MLAFATALALPGFIVALTTGASGILALAADRPVLPAPQPISLAEAAATRDFGEVALRFGYGEDPHRRGPVRLPARSPVMLTALEGAVMSGNPVMFSLVRDHAVVDETDVHHLRCLAERLDLAYRDGRMIAYLTRLDRTGASCEGVDTPW